MYSKKILNLAFAVLFFGALLSVFVESNKNSKDIKKLEEKRSARYEQMLDNSEKTVLTQQILDEDHNLWVERAKLADEAIKTVEKYAIIISIAIIGYCVLSIINSIMDKNKKAFAVIKEIIGCVLICGVVVASGISVRRNMKLEYDFYYKYIDEPYEYVEGTVESKNVRYNVDNINNRYIIRTENRETTEIWKTLEADEKLYNKIDEKGEYYFGKTENNMIFSIYPTSKCSLGKE